MTVEKATIMSDHKPFENIRHADPIHLLNFIRQEHPQVIALVLSHLKPKKASVILRNLPHNMQSEVIRRVACIDRVNPQILCKIELILEKKLSMLSSMNFAAPGGFEDAIKILNLVDSSSKKRIIGSLKNEDPELAEEIRKRSSIFYCTLSLYARDKKYRNI